MSFRFKGPCVIVYLVIIFRFFCGDLSLKLRTFFPFPDLANTDHPDEKSVMTYVSSLYEMFPKEPTVQETLHDNVSDGWC